MEGGGGVILLSGWLVYIFTWRFEDIDLSM